MTAIDPEVKRTLDLRLAKGELDPVQYQELLAALGYGPETQSSEAMPHADLIAEIDDLQIFSTHIQVAGRRKEFSDVKRIDGGSNSLSVNLLTATKTTWISIDFASGDSYHTNEDRTLLGRDRHKKIAQCVSALRSITFKPRMAALVSEITNSDTVKIGVETNETYTLIGTIVDAIFRAKPLPVLLNKNGGITNGKLTLDLKKCRADGVLELGIERTNKYAPGQVYASYRRSILERSRSKALKFDLASGHEIDVVLALLDWLARPNNRLAKLS